MGDVQAGLSLSVYVARVLLNSHASVIFFLIIVGNECSEVGATGISALKSITCGLVIVLPIIWCD